MDNSKQPGLASYQAHMLPNVDYNNLSDESLLFSLADLQEGIVQEMQLFFEALDPVLLVEECSPSLPFLVGHLGVYLSAVMTLYTVHEAEILEPLVITLIEHQTKIAYQHFLDHPINGAVKNHKEKEYNLSILRHITPVSIVTHTIRLEKIIMALTRKLMNNQSSEGDSTKVMCSNEILVKIALYYASMPCPTWRDKLNGLSDNYVINQLAIQLGWLMGYFLHLANDPVENNPFFEVSFPLIRLYRMHFYRMMKAFAEAKHAKEAKESTHIEALLTDIHQLSAKTNAKTTPAISAFQKQFLIAKADIEKTLISLLEQGSAIKLMVMSIFYFWFTLVVPLYHKKPKSIKNEEPFSHLLAMIALIKYTINDLPTPEFSGDIHELNKKMQALKHYTQAPEELDDVPQDEATQQVPLINTAIHTVSSNCLKQDFHPEAVANALFAHWLRLSVFFGISEQEWQKMDYYFMEILNAAKQYISTIANRPKSKMT